MRNFFVEFLMLLAKCILVICLVFASFLLLSNFYHYKEITRNVVVDFNSNSDYIEYKNGLDAISKKFASVDYKKNGNRAKPIYEYYEFCFKSLKEGTVEGFKDSDFVTSFDIYNANREMIDNYSNNCIFGFIHNIEVINEKSKPKKSFDNTKKLLEEKSKIIINNADYLIKSGLGNSSYSFSTDVTNASINNKIDNELSLTINNYNLLVSLLNDVADWYVLEFRGSK